MPVQSKAQWHWMAANRPDLLKKWQAEAPVNYANLKAHVAKKRKTTKTGGK